VEVDADVMLWFYGISLTPLSCGVVLANAERCTIRHLTVRRDPILLCRPGHREPLLNRVESGNEVVVIDHGREVARVRPIENNGRKSSALDRLVVERLATAPLRARVDLFPREASQSRTR